MKRIYIGNTVSSYGKRLAPLAIVISLVCGSCQKQFDKTENSLSAGQSSDASLSGVIGVNVLLKTPATDRILKELNNYGTVLN